MKIILLSGAIKNSGDYLITERCKKILEYVYPTAEIIKIVGNYPLDEQMNIVNTADAMIIAGGPSYTKKLYPRDIPLVKQLDSIRPRLAIMGSGWYGNLTTDKELQRYRFEKGSIELLSRISRDSLKLGCRDFYSVRVLRANGFNNGIMTGCPAWYDIDSISKRLCFTKDIKKIMVSDPADVRSFGKQSLDIVRYLRAKFPEAQIEYVFHRGTTSDKFTSKTYAMHIAKTIEALEMLNISYHDIAYGCDGFKLYDDCDLHVGHRVHAHIYNLSKRNMSILIEEDSRGAGVNEALGLWGIKGYQYKLSSNANPALKAINKAVVLTSPNPYVLKNLDDYVSYCLENHGDVFNIAYGTMEYYFNKMVGHAKSIEKFI